MLTSPLPTRVAYCRATQIPRLGGDLRRRHSAYRAATSGAAIGPTARRECTWNDGAARLSSQGSFSGWLTDAPGFLMLQHQGRTRTLRREVTDVAFRPVEPVAARFFLEQLDR